MESIVKKVNISFVNIFVFYFATLVIMYHSFLLNSSLWRDVIND